MLFYQFILVIGLIPGDYGETYDAITDTFLVSFKTKFWDDIKKDFIISFHKETQDLGIWKLIEAGFICSPLFENEIEFITLIVGVLGCLFMCPNFKPINETFKELRIGGMIAGMYPLLISSINCLLSISKVPEFSPMLMISAFCSGVIVFLYGLFVLEVFEAFNESRFFYHNYDVLDLDWGTFGLSKVWLPRFEILAYAGMLIVMLLWPGTPAEVMLVVTLIHVFMLFANFTTETVNKKMSFKYPEMLEEIQYLKIPVLFFRILLFLYCWYYQAYQERVNQKFVKNFTYRVLMLLAVDALFNFIILCFRIKGFFHDKMFEYSNSFFDDDDSIAPKSESFRSFIYEEDVEKEGKKGKKGLDGVELVNEGQILKDI